MKTSWKQRAEKAEAENKSLAFTLENAVAHLRELTSIEFGNSCPYCSIRYESHAEGCELRAAAKWLEEHGGYGI